MKDELKKAIIKQLNCEEEEVENVLFDVANLGANSGFSGFIYYDDTINFYLKNRKNINEYAENTAKEMGENLFEMISNFNCIKGEYSIPEIAKALYETKNEEYINIYNALSWFVLEGLAIEKENKNG